MHVESGSSEKLDSYARRHHDGRRGDTSDCVPHLSFEEGVFLNIYGRLKFLYIRKGYDELYEDIQALWKLMGQTKLCLWGMLEL